MNKAILGTILGSALIAALKNKATGSGQIGTDMLDREYGTEGGQIKIIAEVEYWAPIVDKNSGWSDHEMDYECRVDWLNGSNAILQKLRKLQSYSEQWFQDNGYVEPDGEYNKKAIRDLFDLPIGVFSGYDLDEILSLTLPNRIMLEESPPLTSEDLLDQAVEICVENEDPDECYEYEYSIPEKYIEEVVEDWENNEWVKVVELYFDVNEETIKYNDYQLRDKIESFLWLIRSCFKERLNANMHNARSMGLPYRINQELSIISVSYLETSPSEFPLIKNSKSSTIRRY